MKIPAKLHDPMSAVQINGRDTTGPKFAPADLKGSAGILLALPEAWKRHMGA
jgi:hypothetical protein